MIDPGQPPDDAVAASAPGVPSFGAVEPVRDRYHPDHVRATITYGLLLMIVAFLLVLSIETVRERLSPQEFAEIVGPVIVGTAAGVFGYYFNPERRG